MQGVYVSLGDYRSERWFVAGLECYWRMCLNLILTKAFGKVKACSVAVTQRLINE